MVTEVERLSVLIEANTKSYERAMVRLEQKTTRAIRGSTRSIDRLDQSFKKSAAAARNFAGALGIGVSIAGFSRAIQSAVRSTAQLVDQADKVGLSVENLQTLRFAAEQNGVAFNTLDMAMQRFSRRIGEASAGSGELLPVLKANNFQIRDAAGNVRPLIDLLKDYANLVKNAASDQEALTLSFKAFDSEGAALVNLFRQGAIGLDEYIERARELNIVLDDDLARSIKEVDDRFGELSARIGTGLKRATLEGVDAIRGLADEIQGFEKTLGDFLVNTFGFVESAEERAAGAARLKELAEGLGGGGSSQVGDLGVSRNPFDTQRGSGQVTVLPTKDDPARARRKSEAERQAEAVDRLIESLKAEQAQIGLTAVEQDVMNTLRLAGVDAMSAEGQQIATLIRQNEALTASFERAQQRADFFAQTAFDGITGLIDGTSKLSDVFRDLAQTIARAALEAALLGSGPLAGGGGGGLLNSIFGGIFGGGGGGSSAGSPLNLLPGFAHGGSGVVPGTGMPDSRLFVARVTPGERYNFSPPGAASSGEPTRVVIEAVPSPMFDIKVREISGDVAVKTAGAMVTEAEVQRRRAKLTGSE